MKNIGVLKKKFLRLIAKKSCGIDDVSQCPNGNDKCECEKAAEIKAYLGTVIPSPYYNLTIDDFTGKHEDVQLLNPSIAVAAKKQIIKYCWGDIPVDQFNGMSSLERREKSVLNNRLKEGRNVIIYSDKHNNNKGKTFAASLIMQEAIRNRAMPGNYVQTYDWLDFSLIEYYMKKEDPILNSSRSADWLVVDDIIGVVQSQNANAYIASKINPFFIERLQDKLPTIFVFRFDILDSAWSIEEKFGTAINKIVEDPRTFKITLCGK